MKPRTKLEKEVDKMIPWVQPLTDEQIRALVENTFAEDYNGYFHNGIVTCMHCGQTFSVYGEDLKCPHCGTKLNMKKGRKYTQKMGAYVCLCQEFNKDWQVFRYFQLLIHCKRGQQPKPTYLECWQKWLSSKGEYVLAALPRGMSFIYDNWRRTEPITIKHPYRNYCGNDYSRWHGAYTLVDSVIPNITRNGFDGNFHGFMEWELFKGLLGIPTIETLYKRGQYDLVKYLLSHQVTSDMLTAIKIANRNHYQIPKLNIWFDYIGLLSELELDVHNAHYVCPEDLDKAHNEMMHRVEKVRDAKRRATRIQTAIKENGQYVETHQKFFGLEISNGVLRVTPLKSVMDFVDEAEYMHHCVFTGSYYQKPDHLILSAKINGKRIETVDVNLNTYEIDQSYGVLNKLTPFHDAIINLVNEHMDEIKALHVGTQTVKLAV